MMVLQEVNKVVACPYSIAGKARTHIRIQIHDYTYFQEHLKYQVLLHDPSLNRDFVDKYVAKYYNKFKYCDVMK